MTTDLSLLPVEARFKVNVGYVGQIVLDIVNKHIAKHKELPDPRLITMGNAVIEGLKAEDIIKVFIKKSNKFWPNIKKREESFFTEQADQVFGKVPMIDLQAFKVVFERKLLNDSEKTRLWDYFNQMVRQAIRYLYDIVIKFDIVVIDDIKFTKAEVLTLVAEYGVKVN